MELRDLDVLVLDCQAGGATPAHGDLLEIGWAACGPHGAVGEVRARWIVPRTERPISRPVRALTGWDESCLASAVDEREAWSALRAEAARLGTPAPTVIHYARFELPFLRDLSARLDDGAPFPLDAVCVHAVAQRLFPDLPRRNIRALAGFLGHRADLVRRAAGHVEATASIWRALLPRLDEAGVRTWAELAAFVDEAPATRRRPQRAYPLAPERRRALPDAPGVYRFLRPNGDVLYVGKAASVKKRVASHFSAKGRTTERALEMLTQVADVDATVVATALEAALLEADEIKRLDPPYNVQLRTGDRRAWFASRDLRRAAPSPDDVHRVGPLPSERAVSGLAAIAAIASGAEASPATRAAATGVPPRFAPPEALFGEGFAAFASEHLSRAAAERVRDVARAALALYLVRGRAEPDDEDEESPPDEWDLPRVRRRLERALVNQGLLLRRARWLCLLASADVAFRDGHEGAARLLVVTGGHVEARADLAAVDDVRARPPRRVPPLLARRACFDAASYDRLRVLATEVRRVHDEGGDVVVRVGARVLAGERVSRILRLL